MISWSSDSRQKNIGASWRFINFKSKKLKFENFWGDLKKIDASDYILF